MENLVLQNRRVNVHQIAETVGISTGSVTTILHEHLLMTKVCARWVPRMLDQKMKDCRCETSNENLKLMQLNWNLFMQRIVTGDETWIHHYDPEMKQQSMQWKHSGSPSPRKFKVHASAGKIMCTVFWDAEGILLIDYMPHTVTITGVYYADLLHKLRDAIKEKRRGKLTKVPLLLHNNAPAHRSHVGQVAVLECGYEEMHHPPYSPDLAPSDYHLFPNLKKHLRRATRIGSQAIALLPANCATVRHHQLIRCLPSPVRRRHTNVHSSVCSRSVRQSQSARKLYCSRSCLAADQLTSAQPDQVEGDSIHGHQGA